MSYPSKITVLAPNFRVVNDAQITGTHSHRLVFLASFATLTVGTDQQGGFTFRERVEVDDVGNGSVRLLRELANEFDADTVVAGLRLDNVFGSLVRVPRDCGDEADSKDALLRMKLALGQPPIDVWWLDPDPIAKLTDVAAQHDLPACWDLPINPMLSHRTLSARAQSMWAAVAIDRMPAGDQRRRVFSDFDRWRTAAANI